MTYTVCQAPLESQVRKFVCLFVFWLSDPLRQYFSLYRAVPQREGEDERIVESKNVQTTPTRTYCKRIGPCPHTIQIVGRPGTRSLPRTIAPPDHPLKWDNKIELLP